MGRNRQVTSGGDGSVGTSSNRPFPSALLTSGQAATNWPRVSDLVYELVLDIASDRLLMGDSATWSPPPEIR